MPLRRFRPWWQRLAAVCLAAWFAVAAMDLPALHACAMHDGTGSPSVAGAHGGGMMDDAMHGAMQDGARPHHMAGDAARDERGSGHAPGHAGHLCTCLGACCGAVAIAPPAPPAFALRPPAPARPVAPGRPAHEYVAAWVDFVLPFATAPPRPAST